MSSELLSGQRVAKRMRLRRCASLIDDEQARAVFETRCRSGDIDVLKLAAAYATARPLPLTAANA